MRNGTCPKCNSTNVFKKSKGAYFGNGVLTVDNSFGVVGSDFESFVCVECGYFENYILDPAKLQQVREKWTRAA